MQRAQTASKLGGVIAVDYGRVVLEFVVVLVVGLNGAIAAADKSAQHVDLRIRLQ